MSRFFHGGLSDSESSSSDEELYSTEEEEEAGASESGSEDESEEAAEESDEEGGSRFLTHGGGMGDDDSDEEDGKRVVKSAKDKRLEEIEGCIKLIENGEKINDWVAISGGGCMHILVSSFLCAVWTGVRWWILVMYGTDVVLGEYRIRQAQQADA